MEKLVLKKEIMDAIKQDQVLFGMIAAAEDISIRRMIDVFEEDRTRERLASATVLNILRKRLGLKDKQLLEELQVA